MFNPTSIDAFLFDLDGTLLDSDDQAVAALAKKLTRLRVADPQLVARRIVMALETPANTAMTMMDLVGLDNLMGAVSDWWHSRRGQLIKAHFSLVPGTDDALRTLAADYRLAVVTTRGKRDACAFLDCFGLRDLFETVVTLESTWRLKPHPAPVRYAAEQMGVSVQRCGMVGDTTVDVRSARRAGAWAVAVLCGFGERNELERAGAHLVCDSPADLPDILAAEAATRL